MEKITIDFGYGNGVQTVSIPKKNLQCVLKAKDINHKNRDEAAVKYALQNPIGEKCLCDFDLSEKKNIVIITSDISRPLPSYTVIPSILDELYKAGAKKENITVVFALGSHRHHTQEEMKHLVGERVFSEVRCEDSDPIDCIHMGTTKNGTPVDITRRVAESDFRIGVGNIEFHYFAGFSGGAKALMPGVSTPTAIQYNHKLMVLPDSCAGKLEGNPLRADIEESETYCHLDYIVNVVLDEHKKVVYGVAGDVTKAHRVGCEYLDNMYRCNIGKRADIVIVSQGGAPKDANLYQTQKALDNSKHAIKKGGTIILIGACNEGFGSEKFKEWLINAPTPHSMIDRIKQKFELGGHKAAAIAMVLENAEIDLISEMDDQTVKDIFLVPKTSAQQAFDDAMKRYGENATVIAMPFGGATLPVADD